MTISYNKINKLEAPYQAKCEVKIGDSVESLDTPVLVVELDAFEKNLLGMKQLVQEAGNKLTEQPTIRMRPHFKTHKSPAVAYLQVQNGAQGICCAKLTEVEALVNGSYSSVNWDILLTNSIVGEPKLVRLGKVAQQMKSKPNHPLLAICADNIQNIHDYLRIAKEYDVQFNIYTEINVGQNRCGIDNLEEFVQIVQEIVKNEPHLHFQGIHAYQGANQHVRSYDERRHNVVGPIKQRLEECLRLLNEQNITCPIITGAGTGSFQFEIESGIYNEVQVGSYLFMDVDYTLNLGQDSQLVNQFDQSLFMYSRVNSINAKSDISPRLIVDAGLKSLSLDSGLPWVHAPEATEPLEYISQGDEHGMIVPKGATKFQNPDQFKLGQIIKLIPGHCDPTINMSTHMVGVRNGKVETIWYVEGRGIGL
jgi:3-hydroxy-D-aspartate aldolase